MSKDYEVGYGKPPKQTQFQKGRSGNPDGRPKGTRNLKTDLLDELGQQIVVREGNRALTVSKQRAVIKRLFEKALKGDIKATNTLLGMMWRVLDLDGGAEDRDAPLGAEEREVMALLEKRLIARANEEAGERPAGCEEDNTNE